MHEVPLQHSVAAQHSAAISRGAAVEVVVVVVVDVTPDVGLMARLCSLSRPEESMLKAIESSPLEHTDCEGQGEGLAVTFS